MRVSLAVAALVLLVVTGCGGVQNEPNLAAAVERTEGEGTMRFDARGTMRDGDEETPVVCSGSADYERDRVAIDCEMADEGQLRLIAIGEDVYVGGDVFGIAIAEEGTNARWAKMSADSYGASLQEQISPQRLLAMLRAASRDTEQVGEEDVRGASSVRYRLTVACDEAELLDCDGTAPVEVWIDEDGLVRRIGFDDETGTGTMEFFDFGAEVEIEPPPADEVVEEDALEESGIPSVPEQPCADTASPITVERAISTLRRHGFEVERSDLGCGPTVAASLTNWVDEHLSCFVLSDARSSAALALLSPGESFERVERQVQNLHCVLYVERTTDPSAGRLDDAFADLKAAIGP